MNTNYQYVQTEIKNYVLSLTLDRPKKKNALNQKMIHEIRSVLDLHKESQDIKVVLISSSCDVFCAGADLEYLNKIKNFSYDENLKDSQELMSLFKTMLLYPKLIISKVAGPAIAGGCGLMTASDIIFATDDSIFGYPEVRIGFIPALVSTFLIEKITATNARELLLTGKTINASTAKKYGLINYLCSKEEIHNDVFRFIQKFIKNTSSKSIETSLNLEQKLEKAAELNAESRMDEDFQKGINAFLKKEPINWDQT